MVSETQTDISGCAFINPWVQWILGKSSDFWTGEREEPHLDYSASVTVVQYKVISFFVALEMGRWTEVFTQIQYWLKISTDN